MPKLPRALWIAQVSQVIALSRSRAARRGKSATPGARRGTNLAARANISSGGGVSFVATFEDGPKNGPQRRTFMAASVPERMWFAPERRVVDRKTVTHDGWMLVGTAPGREPAEPWPGQIEFVLDPERSNINPRRGLGHRRLRPRRGDVIASEPGDREFYDGGRGSRADGGAVDTPRSGGWR